MAATTAIAMACRNYTTAKERVTDEEAKRRWEGVGEQLERFGRGASGG
jgi:hypothetical protein